MKTRVAIGFVLLLGLFYASPAEAAKCSSDIWGGRSAWISEAGIRVATIHAVTPLTHISNHSGCSGSLSSKVILTGDDAACQSGTITKNHPYNGPNISAPSVMTCGSLSYDVDYGSIGLHNGFGEQQFTSTSPHTVAWHPADNDGDGYTVEDDCNDNNPDIYPGRTLSCSDMSQEDKNCNGQRDIEELGPTCENCPLIISLEGNAIHLTNPEAGVWFDLNADGNPEKLSWTLPGAGGAWLALDRNGNGVIDNGLELFSNFAVQQGSTEPNGFAALQMFDANRDGWIDRRDPVFPQLLTWSDRNHDGVSQARELQLLSQVGVTRISLDVKTSKRRDRYGNEFRYWAALISQRSSDVGRYIVDVFLRAAAMTGTR